MTFALAANAPRFKMSPSDPALRPFAYHFQEALNKLVVNINYDQTLYLTVLDAFFMMGIQKVRMADGNDRQLEDDVWVDVGRPWVDRISFDDAILDMAARDLTKMRFAGDRYRCAWSKIKERSGGDFDANVVRTMSPDSKYTYDAGGDSANQIASGQTVDDDELEPMKWLQDIWLPENKQWATFAAYPGQGSQKPLKVVDWEGSPRGPYKYLGLGFVPDNIIPSSPAQNLKGLHDVYNRLMRKLIQQATVAKQVTAFPPGEAKQADNARNAQNGDWLPFNNPKDIQTVTIGTVDGNINAFAMALDEVYNVQAGNLRSLGGLGAEAKTARQEESIAQRASGIVTKMSLNVLRFVGEVGSGLKNLMWDDQALEQQNFIPAGDTGFMVPSDWTPDFREGERDNYTLAVEPYSLLYRDPKDKVRQIFEVLERISPLWPMFAQSGAQINVKKLLAILADNADLKELKEIISIMPQQEGGKVLGGDQNTIRSPANTSRETIRSNVSTGGTSANRMDMLAQAMSRGNGKQMAMGGA